MSTTQSSPEKFTLTLDTELRQQFDHLAAVEDRSVAGTMRMALRAYVASKLGNAPQTFRSDMLGDEQTSVVYTPIDGQHAA